jgi:hypothetical protein
MERLVNWARIHFQDFKFKISKIFATVCHAFNVFVTVKPNINASRPHPPYVHYC